MGGNLIILNIRVTVTFFCYCTQNVQIFVDYRRLCIAIIKKECKSSVHQRGSVTGIMQCYLNWLIKTFIHVAPIQSVNDWTHHVYSYKHYWPYIRLLSIHRMQNQHDDRTGAYIDKHCVNSQDRYIASVWCGNTVTQPYLTLTVNMSEFRLHSSWNKNRNEDPSG